MSAPQQSDGDPARIAGTPRAVITDGRSSQLPDTDPDETQEWLDSLDAVVDHAGRGPGVGGAVCGHGQAVGLEADGAYGQP